MSRISLLSPRTTFPPILRLPATQTGNNVPKSLHKTRRTWKANVHRLDQTVTLLDTYHKKAGSGGTIGLLQGVKMRIKDLRSYRKAGGVEGCVLSRPSKDFTDFGKQLRADVFKRLIAIRDASASTIEPAVKKSS